MPTTTTSTDAQLPAIAGVEDIAKLEREQLDRVAAAKRELAQKEEETNQRFESEREAAVADKRKEAEAELVTYKEQELSRILEQSQSSSVQECERVTAAGAKMAPAIAAKLVGQLVDGSLLA